MYTIDDHTKRLLAFLVVLFLFFSTVLTLIYVQNLRQPISQAASASVLVIIFNDKDKDGRLDPDENFSYSGNPSFSSSIAYVYERISGGSSTNITSSIGSAGSANRVVSTQTNYDYDVSPRNGWTHTKYSVKFLNPSGSCTSSATDLYVCPYASDGSTDNIYIKETSSIIVYLGVNKDTINPSVYITSPHSGQTVSGTTTITASASDNIGVDRVRFYADSNVIGTDYSSPFTASWNTTSYSNNNHTITATAYDDANNTSSHQISVNVSNIIPDTSAPSVPGNLRVTDKGSIWAALDWSSSSDSGGSGLAGYKVYRGHSLIKTTTSSQYTNTGLSASTNYSYYVRAYDNAGNYSGNSNTVSVTTLSASSGNPPPPPPPPPRSGSTSNPPSSGSTSSGSITQTSGISGAISSIKVTLNPVSFLVGEQNSKLSVQGSGVSQDIKLRSDKSSYELSVKGSLPQGITKTLSLAGKNFIDKRKNFIANSDKPSVSLGDLVFGDFDGNQKVNSNDLSLFNKYAKDVDTKGDLNVDNAVNALDFSALLTGLLNNGKIEGVGQDGRLSLKLTTESAKMGEEFTVDVLADTGEKAEDGVDAVISFDTSKLSLSQLNKTNAFKDYTQIQEFEGLVRITALADKDKPISGTNVIATLTFEALSEGETKVEFSLADKGTTESNIASRFSGQDMLASVDNLILDITSDGITGTAETVNAKGSGLSKTIFFGVLILGTAIVLFLLGLFIKRKYLEANKEEVFMPEEVPMDKPPVT